MRRSRIFMLVALAVVMCASSRHAFACSCNSATPCEAVGQAQAVFIGSVLGVSVLKPESGNEKYPASQRLLRFSVQQSFFGVEGQEVELFSEMTSCSYGFRRGVTYLVYALRHPTTGRLGTNICTRTRPLSEAAEDLAYIREAMKEKPGVVIYGEVRRYNLGRRGAEVFGPPIGKIKVIVKGKDGEYQAMTDEEGKYQVANLPGGKYEVMLDLADGLRTRMPKMEFSLGARGCAKADFLVETDGRIVGRVVDVQGRGASQVHLMALRVDPVDSQKTDNAEFTTTEEDGWFLIRGLPPGRYLFMVTHAYSQLYRHGYHPGVKTTADAYAVDVGEGQKIEGVELRLLPAAREYLVNGVVVWPDGRPAVGIEVAWGVPNENLRLTTKTDSQGRFTVRLFAGFKFWINAVIQEPSGAWHASGQMPPIEPADGMEPLKLVLKPQR